MESSSVMDGEETSSDAGVIIAIIIVVILAILVIARLVISKRRRRCAPIEKGSLKGKTVVITGGNSGIGLATAKALLEGGAQIVLACRNPSLADRAIEKLRQQVPNGGELIKMDLDLASFASIRACVDRLKVAFKKIDILILNAGVAVPLTLGMKTDEGHELNFGVNHLGHFLFTNLLIDLLKKGAPSRVVVLSSRLHEKGRINLDDLNSTKVVNQEAKNCFGDYDGDFGYPNSKLMNVYFAKGLAERTKDSGIDVFAACPGFSYTNLFRYGIKWYHYFFAPIAFIIMKTPTQGAQTPLHCATCPELKGKSGTFFIDCVPYDLKINYDKEVENKLWRISEDLVNIEQA